MTPADEKKAMRATKKELVEHISRLASFIEEKELTEDYKQWVVAEITDEILREAVATMTENNEQGVETDE